MEKRVEQTQILYELVNENEGYGDNAYDQTVTGEHSTSSFQSPVCSNVLTIKCSTSNGAQSRYHLTQHLKLRDCPPIGLSHTGVLISP